MEKFYLKAKQKAGNILYEWTVSGEKCQQAVESAVESTEKANKRMILGTAIGIPAILLVVMGMTMGRGIEFNNPMIYIIAGGGIGLLLLVMLPLIALSRKKVKMFEDVKEIKYFLTDGGIFNGIEYLNYKSPAFKIAGLQFILNLNDEEERLEYAVVNPRQKMEPIMIIIPFNEKDRSKIAEILHLDNEENK